MDKKAVGVFFDILEYMTTDEKVKIPEEDLVKIHQALANKDFILENLASMKSSRPIAENAPVGLKQLGNSCYMNSSLQILAANAAFLRTALQEEPVLREPQEIEESKEKQLQYQALKDGGQETFYVKETGEKRTLVDLIEAEESRQDLLQTDIERKRKLHKAIHEFIKLNKQIVSPKKADATAKKGVFADMVDMFTTYQLSANLLPLLKKIREVIFAENFILGDLSGQQDSPEFLGPVLDSIGYGVSEERTKKHSDAYMKKAGNAGRAKTKSETKPRMVFEIPVPKHGKFTLQSSIDTLKKEKHIDDVDNKWNGDTDYEETSTLKEIPEVIMIQLKRFEPIFKEKEVEVEVDKGGEKVKEKKKIKVPKGTKRVGTKITVEDEIDLKKLIDPSLLKKGISTKYRLVSYVTHKGNSSHDGHYKAGVKKGGQWYKCNDSKISTLDEKKAKKKSREAYILVLERIKD